MADNITPLIPMTQRQVALMSPEDQRAYWIAVANVWTRNAGLAQDREYRIDNDNARADDDWCGS